MANGAVIRRQVRTDRPLPLDPAQALEALEMTYPEEQRFGSHLSKTDQEKMATALQVLGYVRDGKSLRAIADLMGFSHNTAAHYRDLALTTIAIPLVEDYRKQELELIEDRINRLAPRANNGDEKAEDQLRKYLELRTRLTGTQKPVQVSSQVHISRADQEVTQLLDGLIEGEVVDDELPINDAPDIAEILSGEVVDDHED